MRAFVGIGGNLGDRLATLRSAVAKLRADVDVHSLRCSSLYETRPLGPSTQPFLNAAAELETTLNSQGLLELLLTIERAHGRVREVKWAARTLDLDLLLALDGNSQVVVDTPMLTVPHPELTRRDFVLVPLAELAPDLEVKEGRVAAQLVNALADVDRTVLRVAAPTSWAD